jgi:AcrR family transcriptional regulator
VRTTTSPAGPVARGQGRRLVLDAAREVFTERGFARAGIREIAARAGVTEPVVYWHFKSKRGLFEAAVTEPFAAFVQEFFSAWAARTPGERPAVEEACDYLTGLYDVLHAQRRLLIAMLADQEFDGSPDAGARELPMTVNELLELHEQLLRPEIAKRGYREFDVRIRSRLFFATIFTAAVHGTLLEPGGDLDRDAYIRELAEMSIHGATGDPATG